MKISEINNEQEVPEPGKAENSQQETAGFISQNAGLSNQITTSVPRPLTHDSVDQMYLADFLSRPVNIYNYTWPETLTVGSVTNIQPWQLFFSDARIKNKLHNFAFLQCVLKVKFVINASPFYYGALLISYQPLHTLTPSNITSGINSDDEFTLRTQRPHVWIYPQKNEGAELTLPYMNYKHWTRTIVNQEFIDLGLMTIQPVTQLQSANGTVGTGVNVGVFAWAEDVTVTGPTVGLTMAQAGDEYGVVSKPSSFIANVASKLVDVPVIGPFARATMIGASAISSIAHMFGFTNVPNIKDVDPMNIKPFSNFSDTSISFPIDKLTMDPKNELTVSQEVAGVPDVSDPLLISTFCEREAYLCNVPFTTANVPNDALFYMNVSPALCNATVINAHDTAIAPTPMAYCAALFRQWRGDIIIKVTVIASRFHKGRIRLIYDPLGDSTNNIVSQANSYSGCVNQVVDITESTTVEMRIPYSQAMPFQELPQFGVVDYQISGTPTFNRDFSKHNGVFMIRCVTALTAPVASSAIQLLVSVRSASVEFANPGFFAGQSRLFSFYPAQSGFDYGEQPITTDAGSTGNSEEHLFSVVYGERIVSLRQLIKRMCYTDCVDSRLATGNGCYQIISWGRIPPAYGYHANGGASAVGLVTPASNFNFSNAILTPLTWLMPCFVGQRGSVNYAISSGSCDGKHRPEIFVARQNIYSTTTNNSTQTAIVTTTGSKYQAANAANYALSASGCAITTGYTNHGFEFQMPLQTRVKFQSAKADQGLLRTTTDESQYDTFNVVIKSLGTQYQSQINIYTGAGTDFNYIFFLNCPSVHQYDAVPTAN